MKKARIVISILATVFFLVFAGFAVWGVVVPLVQVEGGFDPLLAQMGTIFDLTSVVRWSDMVVTIPFLVVCVMGVIALVWLILGIVKKHRSTILEVILFVVMGASALFFYAYAMTYTTERSIIEFIKCCFDYTDVVSGIQGTGLVVGLGLFILLDLVALVLDVIDIFSAPKAPKRVYANAESAGPERVVLVKEDDGKKVYEKPETTLPVFNEDEPAPAPAPAEEVTPVPAPAPAPAPAPQPMGGICGPLLVQYINTYNPGGPCPQPYPAPAPVEPKPEPVKEEAVIPEPVPAPVTPTYGPTTFAVPESIAPVEPEEEEKDNSDDLRKIIREELAAAGLGAKPAPVPAPAPVEEKPREVQAPIIVAMPSPIVPQQQVAPTPMPLPLPPEPKKEEEEKEPALTADDVKTIIRDELSKVLSEIDKIKAAPVAQPAPAPVPAPAPAPVVVVQTAPTPAPVAPAPKPVPPVKKVPVAPVTQPVEAPVAKIVRVPFPERLTGSDKEVKANYNELKSEILSYGVKSRVSNTGDTFRLHTKTYVKITVAGKGLKLYFALNPKDYANTTLPILDAGHKGIYEEIPLVFKVKSELSVRRAKQLIADAMEKDGLEQGKVEAVNWAKEVKNLAEDKD